MEINDFENFEDKDKPYWDQPNEFVLIKSHRQRLDYYTILRIEPRLFMLMADDFEDSQNVANKMIEHGVMVFDNMQDFLNWYAARNKAND